MCDLKKFLVSPEDTLRNVIAVIDRNASGIALVVDKKRRLLGTITDGDIRRAMLAGSDLESLAGQLVFLRAMSKKASPVTAYHDTPKPQLLATMRAYSLRHIPLVDKEGRVVDLALLSDFAPETEQPLTAVVMAGGFGTRMRPLTNRIPKPMLPVGDRPLLERTVTNLRQSGINRIVVTTHYKREKIVSHFGDGSEFGVDINYLQEEQPLGTAGALRQVKSSDGPILVINGDILTGMDFRAMRDFHQEHEADLSMAIRRVEHQLLYGMVESDGVAVTGLSEKPVFQYLANAGIYLLEPRVCELIPDDQPYQMTQLIDQLLAQKRRVVGFLVHEYWRDIGKMEDYQQAQRDHFDRKVS